MQPVNLVTRTTSFKLSIFFSLLLLVSITYAEKLASALWVIYDFIELVIIIIFVAILVTSIVSWKKKNTTSPYVPFCINACTLVLVIMLPLNYIRNRIEFFLFRSDYNSAANFVLEDQKSALPSLYQLPNQYSYLSVGSGKVDIVDRAACRAVVFYTFTGIPDGMSGFVKVSSGNVKECIPHICNKVYKFVDLGDSWYYLSGD
jgi:hypothetical protein